MTGMGDGYDLRREIEAELINGWRTPTPPRRTVAKEAEAYVEALMNDATMLHNAYQRVERLRYLRECERLAYEARLEDLVP